MRNRKIAKAKAKAYAKKKEKDKKERKKAFLRELNNLNKTDILNRSDDLNETSLLNTSNDKTYMTSKGYVRSLVNNTPFSEEAIEGICEELGLSCRFSPGIIYIKTSVCYWRILHDEYEVKEIWLQSLKRRGLDNSFNKFTAGFHKQNEAYFKDYREALEYIRDHDKKFLKS